MRKRTDSSDAESVDTIADALVAHVRNLGNPMVNREPGWASSVRIDDLQELGVLAGLTKSQEERLRTLIAELWEMEQVVPWTLAHRRRRRRWEKYRAGYVRQIARRARAAASAIESLRLYLRKVGIDWNPPHGSDRILAKAVAVLDHEEITRIGGERLIAKRLKDDARSTAHSRADIMRTLFDFFVCDCGLKDRSDAEVRTAKIGNSYWDWDVRVTELYPGKGENWKGSPAVRQAVARRRRQTNTSKRTR
jgi:hypothetical protein